MTTFKAIRFNECTREYSIREYIASSIHEAIGYAWVACQGTALVLVSVVE